VDVYVGRIREKIEATPETPRYLKTLRGAGYRFELPKTREAEPLPQPASWPGTPPELSEAGARK
jgi:DNA-binding winged helix-turn-helix (wHTH) protein